MNRNYVKGRRAEYKTIALLEGCGYRCTRAAGSLGTFDVVGLSATDVVLVSVKANAYVSAVELEAMREFPVPANVRKLIHRWVDRKGVEVRCV